MPNEYDDSSIFMAIPLLLPGEKKKVNGTDDKTKIHHQKSETCSQCTPYSTYSVIAIQACLYLILVMKHGITEISENPMIGSSIQDIKHSGGNDPEMVKSGQYWRLVVSLFYCTGLLNLIFSISMLLLLQCVEKRWGSLRWSIVFLTSGICGNIYSIYVEPDAVSVGQAGSILGMVGALHIDFMMSLVSFHYYNCKINVRDNNGDDDDNDEEAGTKVNTKVNIGEYNLVYNILNSVFEEGGTGTADKIMNIGEHHNIGEQHLVHNLLDSSFERGAYIMIGLILGSVAILVTERVNPEIGLTTKTWGVFYGGLMSGLVCGCIMGLLTICCRRSRRRHHYSGLEREDDVVAFGGSFGGSLGRNEAVVPDNRGRSETISLQETTFLCMVLLFGPSILNIVLAIPTLK